MGCRPGAPGFNCVHGDRQARHAAAAAGSFASSFEADDPQPTWTDTVETDAAGAPRSSGVDGDVTVGIPGNSRTRSPTSRRTPSRTAARAGEPHRRRPGTKWLVFAPTGWAQFTLAEPVEVVRYALTSANDAPSATRGTGRSRARPTAQTWTTLDTQAGQTFDERFQTKEYDVAERRPPYLHYRLDITANNGAATSSSSPSCSCPTATPTPPPPADMQQPVGTRPGQLAHRQGGRRLHRPQGAAVRGRHTGRGPGVLVQQGLRRRPRGRPRHRAVLPDLPRVHRGRPELPGHLRRGRPGLHRRHLPERPRRRRPARRRAQPARRRARPRRSTPTSGTTGVAGSARSRPARPIDRILVGYDNPSGPATFRGWVDDITIADGAPGAAAGAPVRLRVTTRGTHSSGELLPRQQLPGDRGAARLQLLDPGDQRRLHAAGCTSTTATTTRTTCRPSQAFARQPRAQPVDGRPADVPGDAVRRGRHARTPTATARALPFRHENEIARPHYYGVTFENGLKTEIAPTDHAAMLRFTFPATTPSLIFDNVNNNGGLTLDAGDRRRHRLLRRARAACPPAPTRLFVYADVRRAGHGERHAARRRRRGRHRLRPLRHRRRPDRHACGSPPR